MRVCILAALCSLFLSGCQNNEGAEVQHALKKDLSGYRLEQPSTNNSGCPQGAQDNDICGHSVTPQMK